MSTARAEYLNKINNLSFEQALKELEQIVTSLETGQESLEKSIDDYQYGNALSEYCLKKLEDAKLKVDKVMQQADGSVTIEAVKIDEASN